MQRPTPLLLLLALILPLLAGCGGGSDVVIYVALDMQHSKVLLQEFEKETGLTVKAQYDREANKTVGLVNQLVEEADRPRCDVFWNNEIVNTIKLQKRGLLVPYTSPSAADIPARWKDPQGFWTGFGARARVFIVNTRLIPDPKDYPRNLADLVDPKWKGKCAMARPRTGTTLTHFAALHLLWGEKRLQEFCQALAGNEVAMMAGNAHVMRQVSDGKFAWGLTDTDDYNVSRTKGNPVAMVYPDQEGMGTMVIPNTVCLIKGGPNPEAGRKLIDWILSRKLEEKLAAARSAQIPVRTGIPKPAHVKSPSPKGGEGTFKSMAWDAVQVGEQLDRLAPQLKELIQ